MRKKMASQHNPSTKNRNTNIRHVESTTEKLKLTMKIKDAKIKVKKKQRRIVKWKKFDKRWRKYLKTNETMEYGN